MTFSFSFPLERDSTIYIFLKDGITIEDYDNNINGIRDSIWRILQGTMFEGKHGSVWIVTEQPPDGSLVIEVTRKEGDDVLA